MDEKSIIDNLEKLRVRHGYSKTEVADRLGVARNTYGNLVSGITKVINENLPLLADLYGVGLDELLLGYKPVHSLNGPKDFEEQRLELINSYEDRLQNLNKEMDHKDSLIEELQRHNKSLLDFNAMLKRQLGEK